MTTPVNMAQEDQGKKLAKIRLEEGKALEEQAEWQQHLPAARGGLHLQAGRP